MVKGIKRIVSTVKTSNILSKNVLITGATGFIGGFLVEESLRQGYSVFAAVRKTSNTTHLKSLGVVNFVIFDFDDIVSTSKIITKHKIDYIINNAGLTRSKSQAELNKVNAESVGLLLKSIEFSNHKIKRLVHISSLAAFGPADFTKEGIVTNATIPRPVTMYGKSKLAGESILKKQTNQSYVIIRPTVVFGPKEKDLFTVFKMINGGIQTKVGFKAQKLTFIYVKDLVVYMVNALTHGKDRAEYFISDNNTYSNHEFNELIRTSLNKKTIKLSIPLPIIKVVGYISEYWGNLTNTYPPLNIEKIQEIKAKSWNCDTTKNAELGYEPKYSLKKGVEETVSWYKKNDWL